MAYKRPEPNLDFHGFFPRREQEPETPEARARRRNAELARSLRIIVNSGMQKPASVTVGHKQEPAPKEPEMDIEWAHDCVCPQYDVDVYTWETPLDLDTYCEDVARPFRSVYERLLKNGLVSPQPHKLDADAGYAEWRPRKIDGMPIELGFDDDAPGDNLLLVVRYKALRTYGSPHNEIPSLRAHTLKIMKEAKAALASYAGQ